MLLPVTWLWLFDVDGTLVESFLRAGAPRSDYDRVQPLPGRRAKLAELRAAGGVVALVTNQAGVSHGYQTETQVHMKMRVVKSCLGLPQETPVFVCFAHPTKPAECGREFDRAWDPGRRKPSGRMLEDAMELYGARPEWTAFIGDMDTDLAAARNAGVAYYDAEEFFA